MQNRFDSKGNSSPPKTKRGYFLDELLSALQKDIRRGKEYNALFWAIQLQEFNDKALWNRLKVIASEDIGIANPMAILVVDILEKHYYDAGKRKNESNKLFMVNAVLYLARSAKSRIVDDLLITIYNDVKSGKLQKIPDYALDKHTVRGRTMGRGFEHFLKEGAKLENEVLENPYKESATRILSKKK